MSTFVKICGLTDKAAVDAAVDAGADAIGFVFHAPSPRHVVAEKALRISAGIPAHIQRVAVMLHPDNLHWQEVATVFRPDVLQTDAADFNYLTLPDAIDKWPVLREGAVAAGGELPDTYIYEGLMSGKGEQVDWTVAAEIARRGRMILAGGLDADNVTEAIHRVAPYGVDVSSAVESAPGQKDAEKIAAFVAAAKSAA